jgi:hypothetical protein
VEGEILILKFQHEGIQSRDCNNTQNFWVFGLCPSSGILETRNQRFGNCICFRPQVRGKTPTLLDPLERANLNHWTTLIKVKVKVILRPTVSRPVCLGTKYPSGAYDQILIIVLTVAGLLIWGALSDEKTSLQFAIATDPRQRSHFRVRVP